MYKIWFAVFLCLTSYFLGRSHSQIKTVTKEVEVIKYVTKEYCKIASETNLERDALLELMRHGKL